MIIKPNKPKSGRKSVVKTELERERAHQAARLLTNSVAHALRSAASLGVLPVGADPTLDAWRALSANLLVMPPGQWKQDALPVSLDWSAMDQVLLADLLVVSGRPDVMKAAQLPWRTLENRITRDPYLIFHHNVYQPLGEYLNSTKEYNWVVSRLLRRELDGFSETTRGLGLTEDTQRIQRATKSLFDLGLDHDTRLPTECLGLCHEARFIDVSLIHEEHKLTKALLPKAKWTTPQQAAETLWALSLRSVQDWEADATAPAPLRDGTLAEHLIALLPDPNHALDLSVSMSVILGATQLSGIHPNTPREVSSPLVFACLLALHANTRHTLPATPATINQWCLDQVERSPDLLARVRQEVLLPLLDRVHFAEYGALEGKFDWTASVLFDRLSPHLPMADQQALAVMAFEGVLDRFRQGRSDQPYGPLEVSSSFPVVSTLPRACLSLECAQKFCDFMANSDLTWSDWGPNPVDHPDFAPLLAMFEPALVPAIGARLEQLAHVMEDPNQSADQMEKRLDLLAKAALTAPVKAKRKI